MMNPLHPARSLFILALLALLFSNAYATPPTQIPKHSGVTIPVIDTVVENFSVKVQLPTSWVPPKSSQHHIFYNLQGQNKSTKAWVNVFGTGPQANTTIALSTTKAKTLNVVVPKFAGNSDLTNYRLMFVITYDVKGVTNYNNMGTILLNDGTHDNNGSLPGYTYQLLWQNDASPLSPQPGGANALKSPAHPPKLGTHNNKQVFLVWDNTSQSYQPFFVRGVDYEPTPVGQPWTGGTPAVKKPESVTLASFNTNGGGQICNPLPSGPFGTPNQSYCFDTDMTGKMHSYLNNTPIEGVEEPNAVLPSRWKQDLEMMQAMGVNTIRIYHIDALVRDMTDFLNMAHEYGIYVIMPAPAPNGSQSFSANPLTGQLLDWHGMTTETNGQAWSALMQLELARYAAHPAILAWAVGNETEADTGKHPNAAKAEWTLAKTIKDFDSNLLVTATNQDHYNAKSNFIDYYEVFQKYTTGTETYLDFYSINSYRGMNATGLQISGMQSLFDILDSLSAPYDLPLLISEWGKYDTYDWGNFDNQWGFNRLWRMILTTNSNILGIAYFEFSDEPIAKNLATQHYMGLVAYSLADDYLPTDAMAADSIVKKFKDYDGIKIKDKKASKKAGKDVYFQNYPPVNQAGIFNSFIGDNTNPLTQDISLTVIPNISYCAFSESSSPWSIDAKCLTLDVSKEPSASYTINVTPAGTDTIQSLKLNGTAITSGSSQTETGIITFTVKGSSKSANVSLGYSLLGNTPASNTNTLLYNNLQGSPSTTWSPANSSINIALPPVDGG